MIHLFLAWLITVLAESFIYSLFVKKNLLHLFLYSILINSFTLPFATFGYLNIVNNIYFIELTVALVESFMIMALLKLSYKEALIISFTGNLFTAMIGFLLIYF